jgi:hypothetical protein
LYKEKIYIKGEGWMQVFDPATSTFEKIMSDHMSYYCAELNGKLYGFGEKYKPPEEERHFHFLYHLPSVYIHIFDGTTWIRDKSKKSFDAGGTLINWDLPRSLTRVLDTIIVSKTKEKVWNLLGSSPENDHLQYPA